MSRARLQLRWLVWGIALAALLGLAGCAARKASPTPSLPVELSPTAAEATALPSATPISVVIDESRTRVGLVTGGGRVDDGSLNQSVYEGLGRAAAELDFDTAFIESLQPGDFLTNAQTFVAAGYDVIVLVGEAANADTAALAAQNRSIRFVAVDPPLDADVAPMIVVRFDEQQLGYLAGAAAGLMSHSKTVGMITGEANAATEALAEGYRQGVARVCAACTVLTLTLDTANDLTRGRAGALRQTGEGADVIFGVGGPSGSAALLSAATQDAWAIGVDSDAYVTVFGNGKEPGAKRLLTSAIKRGDAAIYAVLQDVLAGKLTTGTRTFDAASGGIGLAPFHDADVPADVQAQLEAIIQSLAQGN